MVDRFARNHFDLIANHDPSILSWSARINLIYLSQRTFLIDLHPVIRLENVDK